MTREEIENIPELVDLMLDESITVDTRMKLHKRLEELCKLAIKALEQEPCEDANANQHNSNALNDVGQHKNALEDDAISRQAVLDAFGLSEKTRKYGGDHSGYDTMMLYEIQQTLENLPTVTPKQRTGHWIVHPKGIYAHLVCDKCLTRAPYDCKTNYCPTCGIKMVEPQESEGVE